MLICNDIAKWLLFGHFQIGQKQYRFIAKAIDSNQNKFFILKFAEPYGNTAYFALNIFAASIFEVNDVFALELLGKILYGFL